MVRGEDIDLDPEIETARLQAAPLFKSLLRQNPLGQRGFGLAALMLVLQPACEAPPVKGCDAAGRFFRQFAVPRKTTVEIAWLQLAFGNMHQKQFSRGRPGAAEAPSLRGFLRIGLHRVVAGDAGDRGGEVGDRLHLAHAGLSIRQHRAERLRRGLAGGSKSASASGSARGWGGGLAFVSL